MVTFIVPESTYTGTQVHLLLPRSETCPVRLYLCIHKSPRSKLARKRKPVLLDQKRAVTYPRKEPKPNIQETQEERREVNFIALTPCTLDAT